MKRKIAAAIAAAALAIIPASGAVSANAATTAYNTDRTYTLCLRYWKGLNAEIELKHTRNYSPSATAMNIGTIRGSLAHNYGGAELLPYPAPSGQTSVTYSGTHFTPDRPTGLHPGIVMSFTCTHSLSSTPEQLGYNVEVVNQRSFPAPLMFFSYSVRMGDVSAYINGSSNSPAYDGITSRDAQFVSVLIEKFGGIGFNQYSKVVSLNRDFFEKYSLLEGTTFTISGKQVSVMSAMKALLASDINNDGCITSTDAAAIQKRIANPSRYPNFMYFNGKTDTEMYLLINR